MGVYGEVSLRYGEICFFFCFLCSTVGKRQGFFLSFCRECILPLSHGVLYDLQVLYEIVLCVCSIC